MDDEGDRFELAITGPGFTFKREGDFAQVSRAIAAFAGELNEPKAMLKGGVGAEPTPDTPPVSLRERLDEVGAKAKTEIILTIADWLIQQTRAKNVSRDEIQASFADASEPLPGNFHRDFMKVVKEGWLAPTHGEKDRFYPTTKGRKAIENRFDR